MASRPVYIPNKVGEVGVEVKEVEFKWFPGMAKSQKQKSIISLHEEANTLGVNNILEISSKSENPLGVNLSAFNLSSSSKNNVKFTVETAFQSSKVFEHSGPHKDLLYKSSLEAKKDIRLKESGNLIKFIFFDEEFSLDPKTFFYDWVYLNTLHKNKGLAEEIMEYSAFTDIEFNPKKSINCQAFSAALYVSLSYSRLLDDALKNPEDFLDVMSDVYKPIGSELNIQKKLC